MTPAIQGDIMTVSSFIKENRVLVAGLVLPLLLIGVLAIAKTVPASMVPLPEHKVMYYSQGWSSKGQIAIKVDTDGKLNPTFNETAQYKPAEKETNPITTIYLYDPKTNTVEETNVTLDKDGKVTALEKFKDIKLSTQTVASDGYIFEPYHYRNYSLITDIFSYRNYNSGPALTNKGRIINIPQARTYYGTLEFLGWETSK
jgi:hypothetical protein